jgi:phosphoribosyl-ATP pyrophosphohydrolase
LTLTARVVYAVVGKKPVAVEDIDALDRICQRLVEAEEAHEILHALGYGKRWNTLAELAQMVPHSTALLVRPKK